MNYNSPIIVCFALMLIASSLHQVQGNLISVKGVSPDLALASGNRNGAGGITKNKVAGNQDEKMSVELYQNSENSQSQGGNAVGGLLSGLL